MKLFNNYHLITLILIVHAKYLFANVCYECTELVNHTITTDNLATTINTSACKLGNASTSCTIRFIWFADGKTEIFFTSDLGVPVDTITTSVDRRAITWSAEYLTRRYFFYTCQPSNTTPCNTIENVKYFLASTIYPTDDQIQKFDSLIAPTTEFFGGTCSNLTNATECASSNLASCQQCMAILEYSNNITACAMCPPGKAIANFYEYSTTYFFKTQQRSDTVKLGCRKFGPCNSVENLSQIKNTLYIQFDFTNSTDNNNNTNQTTTTPSTGTTFPLSPIVFYMFLFFSFFH